MSAPSFGPDRLEAFRAVVERRLGLHFDETRLPFVADVLRRRAEAAGLSPEAFVQRLDAAPAKDDLRALAKELTIAESYFFRHMDQFRAFVEHAVAERADRLPARAPLRVLSAGCASGEEAYTCAILLSEWSAQTSRAFEIRAVDVNPTVLERAARGRYSAWSLRETPPELERRWFAQEGSERVISPRIRSAVSFDERNLVEDDPELWRPGGWDVIFCRNVLMYFPPAQMRALVARMTDALAPGGFLFLGHAETLRGVSRDFHLRHTHGTFYYQLREGGPERAGLAAPAAPTYAGPPPGAVDSAGSAPAFAPAWMEAIQRSSSRIAQLQGGDPVPPAAPPAVPAPAPVPAADLEGVFSAMRAERFDDALAMVHALPRDGQDPDLLLLRATLLAHGGRFEAAEALCAQLLAIDELCAGAHYVLALCREGAGDWSGAVDHDRAAVYLDPAFAMPRLHLGLLARRHAEREAARRELGQAFMLLQLEEPSRVLLFGGGFTRDALVALCRAELVACGGST